MEARKLLADAGVGSTLHQPAALLAPLPLPLPLTAASSPSTGLTISQVQFEPLTGRVLVVFSGDLASGNSSGLTDPANYAFRLIKPFTRLPMMDQSRPKAGVVLAPTFAITGVSLARPVAGSTEQTVIVQINNNQPLRDGIYQFVVHSNGTADTEGRPLDGEYLGVFPTGDGQPGGDFVANLAVSQHAVSTALALPSTGIFVPVSSTGSKPFERFLPTTTAVRLRYAAANKPGRFMLAGGNHITLITIPPHLFRGSDGFPASGTSTTPTRSQAK